VFWHTFWQFLHTWQGYIPAAITVAAAVYYGPQKVLETWDWYLDRFRDQRVMDVVRRKRQTTYVLPRNSMSDPHAIGTKDEGWTAEQIAESTGREVSSVSKSLRRLARRKKVSEGTDGWRET
jgi:hypothetical protein